MAREDFLLNLRTAARFLSPEVHVNGIRLGPEHVGNVLKRALVWLTPKSVEGFDPEDFSELPERERDELSNAVAAFRDVASKVPGNMPATREQFKQALPSFVAILEKMKPYLRGFRIYSMLKDSPGFPDFVRDFAVRVGEDSTGDSAAWVWVIIDDQMGGPDFYEHVPAIRDRIEGLFSRSNSDLYPYISIRTKSEQESIEATE